MARPTKKTVYERIEVQLERIKEEENLLVNLKQELQELYNEKDDLEMHQLLDMMKSQNLSIDQALKSLSSQQVSQ